MHKKGISEVSIPDMSRERNGGVILEIIIFVPTAYAVVQFMAS